MKTIFTFLLVLGIALSSRGQKEILRLNLENGKTYRQVMVMNSTVKQEVAGQKMTVTVGMEAAVSYLVKGITGEVYDIEMRYDSMKMTMNVGAGPNSFNSQKKEMGENDYLSRMLKELVNSPIRMKMTRRGQIQDVQNLDSVMNTIYDKLSVLPTEQLNQLKSQMENSFGSKSFKNNFEMSAAIYPDKAIEKGDTWNVALIVSQGMSFMMNVTYKYAEKVSNHMLLSGHAGVTTDKDKVVEIGDYLFKYDLKGGMVSKTKVDAKSGWVIEGQMDQDLSGNMTMNSVSGQLPETVVPMKIHTEIRIFGN